MESYPRSVGPLATGAGVIENKKVVEDITTHSRKLTGIDMETYDVFYAVENSTKPKPLAVMSLKSISDFANPDKDDNFQKYAAYTSARLLYNVALNDIDFDAKSF